MTEQENITPPEGFKQRNFTQVISLMVGAALFVLGACGLLFPGFAGLHLGILHSLILAMAGGTLFYHGGWKDNSFYAFMSCFFFGAFFGLLGLVGFIFGKPGTPSIGFNAPDPHLFVLIKGVAEYGRLDHIMNAIVGIILFGGALDWQRRMGLLGGKRLRDDAREESRKKSSSDKRPYKLTPRHQ